MPKLPLLSIVCIGLHLAPTELRYAVAKVFLMILEAGVLALEGFRDEGHGS
jgi:hypothetical protein